MVSLDAKPQGSQALPDKRTYSSDEAAALLGVSRNVLRDNWQQFGGIRVGRKLIRFPKAAIDGVVTLPCEPEVEPVPAVPADPRVDVLVRGMQVVARELARLLASHRRDATDPELRSELTEARMAVEDCLDGLNAVRAA